MIEKLSPEAKTMLNDFLNQIDYEKGKEIERLHSIIKEVRKYIKDEEKEGSKLVFRYEDGKYYEAGILEILDKVDKEK